VTTVTTDSDDAITHTQRERVREREREREREQWSLRRELIVEELVILAWTQSSDY
jgi:hypothetical protein